MILHFGEEAEAELLAAAEWYEERGHEGLGERLVARVGDAVGRIVAFPGSFLVLFEERGVIVRRVLVNGFPYQVVYGEVPGPHGAELWVFAVAHLRREPGYWRGRVRRSH